MKISMINSLKNPSLIKSQNQNKSNITDNLTNSTISQVNLNSSPAALLGKNSVNFGAKLNLPESCIEELQQEFGLNTEDDIVTLKTYSSQKAQQIFKKYGNKALKFEEELLSKVNEITFDADFQECQVSSLDMLKTISGSGDFRNSNITSLPRLEQVFMHLYLNDSNVTDVPLLRRVGTVLDCRNSKVKSFPILVEIGDCAHFEHSDVEFLPKLKNIGWDAHFNDSKVKSLPALKEAGNDFYYSKGKKPQLNDDFRCFYGKMIEISQLEASK